MSSTFSQVPFRILLVGLQPLFGDSLARLLEADNEFTVVGKLASVREAVNGLPTLRPTLLIADLDLPHRLNLPLAKNSSSLPMASRLLC